MAGVYRDRAAAASRAEGRSEDDGDEEERGQDPAGGVVGLAFTALHLLNGVFLGERFELPVVSRVEHAAQDWALTRLRGPRAPSGRVVIVAIDERSVEAEGRWPWSRAKLARLVDRLAA